MPTRVCAVVEVPAGEYEIGDDSVSNASPRHRRTLRRPAFIDVQPVSWADFEEFVIGGGYRRNELWPDWAPHLSGVSVDRRCAEVLASAEKAAELLFGRSEPRPEDPIGGLNWFEASAVARFFGARLPHEVEWEVAMSGEYPRGVAASTLASQEQAGKAAFPRSRIGCTKMVGWLQEWTADPFFPRYWRADFHRVAATWPAQKEELPAVVRGACPEDVSFHLCRRFGELPGQSHALRVFRRVWNARPMSPMEEDQAVVTGGFHERR